MSVSPIPEGFTSITPHIVVPQGKGTEAIAFYKKAFGAEEVMCMPGPDGKSVMHAEMKFGNALVMLGEEWPGCEHAPQSPSTLNGTTSTIHLYVTDADAAQKRAIDAGATERMPVTDMFWGDRYGGVSDPFGHHWAIATHVRDLTSEQCAKAAEEFFASMPQG